MTQSACAKNVDQEQPQVLALQGKSLPKTLQWLRIRFYWHLNVAIGLLGLLVNREEMLFNLFENGGIVIDHTTVETHLNWCVGHQQVLPFMAIEVFDPPFLIPIATKKLHVMYQLPPGWLKSSF